jgi:hypothetical protein
MYNLQLLLFQRVSMNTYSFNVETNIKSNNKDKLKVYPRINNARRKNNRSNEEKNQPIKFPAGVTCPYDSVLTHFVSCLYDQER